MIVCIALGVSPEWVDATSFAFTVHFVVAD